jgi:hypothetical protein
MDYYNDCVIRFNDVLKVEIRTKKLRLGKQPQSGDDTIKARTLEAVPSQTARVDTIEERTLEAQPTLEACKAAMLAVPSPTARVQLLGQLNCDWVTQCCMRKGETPDHCTFGLDGLTRQCTRPVHFESQLAWETYAKLSHEKKCSSKICREHHPQYQHWREVHIKPVEGTGIIFAPKCDNFCFTREAVSVFTSRTLSPSTTLVTTSFSHQSVFTKDTSTILTLTRCTSQLNYLQGQPLALLLIN